MSHFHTDNNKLNNFYQMIKNNAVMPGKRVTLQEIDLFERDARINLTQDLKCFLLENNGFAADEIVEMSRFWQLDEYQKITTYFNSNILSEITINHDRNVYKRLVDIRGEWLLTDPEKYYLFADYNFNGSYWAIKVGDGEYTDTPVLTISDCLNIYRKVASSFTEFISTFCESGPEALL